MRALRSLAVLALAIVAVVPAAASAARPCTARLLVLSAMPSEIDPLLVQARAVHTVRVDGHIFYTGSLKGNAVIMGLTGIGLVNAEAATRAAFEHFRCGSSSGINGVVFSGVSGGRTFIGDVTVPARWTQDSATWFAVDAEMLQTASSVVADASGKLARDVPIGDPACVGVDADVVKPVQIEHAPEIIVGGDGHSADPFGGRALPCAPGGGDVFGCRPCHAPGASASETSRFVTGAVPFLDPDFFFGYFASPPSTTPGFDAEDMETAAVARVAGEHATPFIAFRALSDGMGDPLMLPGFPFQFFVYRELAAENAATVTLAFLEAWAQH